MGYYVHLSVVFACDKNDGVAEIAKRHLDTVGENREARWFLEDLSTRTGSNPGPKGGLSLWGAVGNYTNAEEFVNVLRPFWLALLADDYEGGPCGFEHVIVFTEPEQTERATAFEIFRDEADDSLTVKKHELPFAWMQM